MTHGWFLQQKRNQQSLFNVFLLAVNFKDLKIQYCYIQTDELKHNRLVFLNDIQIFSIRITIVNTYLLFTVIIYLLGTNKVFTIFILFIRCLYPVARQDGLCLSMVSKRSSEHLPLEIPLIIWTAFSAPTIPEV